MVNLSSRAGFPSLLCLLSACGGGGRQTSGQDEGIGTDPSDDSSATDGADSDGNTSPILDVGNGMDGADEGPVGDPCEQAAEAQSNQGCEFWAVDLPNAWAGINGSPAPEDQQFAVVIANTSADAAAHVEVFLGASNTPTDSADVGVDQIHTFELPAASIPPRQNSDNGVAYRIESDLPITAYQFNPLDNTVQVFSNDASLLFPLHVLATDYTAVTGDAILLGTDEEPQGDNSGAYVSIVATEDATTVDLYPTWGLYPGLYTDVMLDKGEVFTAISQGPETYPGITGDGNLSSSRVIADKPVAVFSGNVATIEPNPGACCADHMEHQMLPLVAWGNVYAAAPPPAPGAAGNSNPAAYRITGAYDGTQLVWSPLPPPGAPTSVDADETLLFQTQAAFVVSSADPDKPFAVTQFLLSNQAINGFGQPGDPAMIVLPALEQFQNEYVFPVPDGYTNNYVIVIRPEDEDVMLDGTSVGAGNWAGVGSYDGTDFEYIRLELTVGSHRIESAEPVGIVSVGYAQDVSYGYPGGSGLAQISEPPPPPQG